MYTLAEVQHSQRMRIVSFGDRGMEQAGVLSTDGLSIFPLTTLDPKLPNNVRALIAGNHLSHVAVLAKNAEQTRENRIPLTQVRLGPPVTDPSKIICIGLNFKGHATEQGKPWPLEPLLFAKAPTALCAAGLSAQEVDELIDGARL